MSSPAQADNGLSATDTPSGHRDILDFNTLMGIYASARQSPMPFLLVSSEDAILYTGLWEEFAAGRELSAFDQTHYERFKVTAGMFGRHLPHGEPIVELGMPTLFGDFVRERWGGGFETYDADLRKPFALASESVNCVLCLEVLAHIKDDPAQETTAERASLFNYSGVVNLLAESYRILKPGGVLLITTPNATSVDVMARLLAGDHPHLFDPHVREYAPNQVRAFAEHAGFALEAFGTYFAWGSASSELRSKLLGVIAELGFDPSNRGDDACFVFRKTAPGEKPHVYQPGVDDFSEMTGQSAAWTAAYWRERHLIGIVPEYEDVLRVVYERFLRPGDTIVDVGVNIGLHFTRFNQLVGTSGRVIGFEPVPDFAAHSRHLVGATAEIREKALSDASGRGEFLHMTRAVGESGFKERASGGDRGVKPIQVEISTMDAELSGLDALRYIKIDTEGHEISVLRGATETLRRLRPLISVEWGAPTYSLYGHDRYALFDLATVVGYRVSDLFGNLVADRDEWARVSDVSYWDYFLVPVEQTEAWGSLFEKSSG